MKLILLFLLLPAIIYSQSTKTISYQEGLEHCQKLIEEKQKQDPGHFFMVLPDCLVGVQVPEFSGTTLEGKKITSNYFKGKITIVNFWSLYCQPCIAEIPGFNALIDKFGKGDVQYLAIGNESDADIKEFLQQNPWHFEQVSNGPLIQKEIFQHRSGYPTTFVINREGTIISTFAGGSPDENAVEEIQSMLSPVLEKELHQFLPKN